MCHRSPAGWWREEVAGVCWPHPRWPFQAWACFCTQWQGWAARDHTVYGLPLAENVPVDRMIENWFSHWFNSILFSTIICRCNILTTLWVYIYHIFDVNTRNYKRLNRWHRWRKCMRDKTTATNDNGTSKTSTMSVSFFNLHNWNIIPSRIFKWNA